MLTTASVGDTQDPIPHGGPPVASDDLTRSARELALLAQNRRFAEALRRYAPHVCRDLGLDRDGAEPALAGATAVPGGHDRPADR